MGYVEDFIVFPRDAEHTPEWLVKRLRKHEGKLRDKGIEIPW